MASSLVMFPAISRKAMVQTGTMPLLQSRTIPRYRNPSAAQSDGTDDGLQFHIL